MRLIDADNIKYTEYANGDVMVSKDEIDKMPIFYDICCPCCGEKIELMKPPKVKMTDIAIKVEGRWCR